MHKQLLPTPALLIVSMLAMLCSCSGPAELISNAGYGVVRKTASPLSWRSLQTERVVMQQHEYSCGAAALATMMTYYFGNPTSELEVLDDVDRLFSKKERSVIRAAGLSLSELSEVADAMGYQSSAVKLDPAVLANLPGPVIVFIRTDDYSHFAVLREVTNGRALVADPSRGNLSLTIPELLDVWQGETLVLGMDGFGVPESYPLRSRERTVVEANDDKLRRSRLSPYLRLPR